MWGQRPEQVASPRRQKKNNYLVVQQLYFPMTHSVLSWTVLRRITCCFRKESSHTSNICNQDPNVYFINKQFRPYKKIVAEPCPSIFHNAEICCPGLIAVVHGWFSFISPPSLSGIFRSGLSAVCQLDHSWRCLYRWRWNVGTREFSHRPWSSSTHNTVLHNAGRESPSQVSQCD